MKKKHLLLSVFVFWAMVSFAQSTTQAEYLRIQKQGSFLAGGTIVKAEGTYDTQDQTNPQGQTLHGDHAYVSYQIPVDAHRYPLVFLHGAGQSGKTWETTPDGREGFGTLFLRRGFRSIDSHTYHHLLWRQ